MSEQIATLESATASAPQGLLGEIYNDVAQSAPDLVVDPAAEPVVEAVQQDIDFGQQLKDQTTGCRLTTFALSARRTMPKNAVDKVAGMFSAEPSSVGGSRQVINRQHPLVKPVLQLLAECKALVQSRTIDYPEKGVRLIKLDRVEWLSDKINQKRQELAAALQALDEGWDEVKEDARQRLGDLFSDADYAIMPSNGFGVELTFPAIKPDDRLAKLHPELYAAEQARIQAKFADAVANAEAACAAELSDLIAHLIERMQPSEDGKKKVVKDAVVDNLVEFADRWKSLSVGQNKKLDDLVAQVDQLARGIDIEKLRKDGNTRDEIKAQFDGLYAKLDDMVIAAPHRQVDLD